MKKLKHKTILLVEDNPSELSEIKNWINSINENHTLCVVKNCREALDLLNGSSNCGSKILPDVILLNIYSPVMDGVEFLEIIKSYFSLRSIKVFFMISAFNDDEKKVSMQFNVDGIIAKPFCLNFSNGQTASIEKLKADLTNSSTFRLHSFFIFPIYISEGFSGLSNFTKQLLQNTIEFIRSIAFIKPVAITSLVITTALITAATTITIKRKAPIHGVKIVNKSVLKTKPVDISNEGKVAKNKIVTRSNRSEAREETISEVNNTPVIPDTVISSPSKEMRKTLKIVVIEEEDELYQDVSEK